MLRFLDSKMVVQYVSTQDFVVINDGSEWSVTVHTVA